MLEPGNRVQKVQDEKTFFTNGQDPLAIASMTQDLKATAKPTAGSTMSRLPSWVAYDRKVDIIRQPSCCLYCICYFLFHFFEKNYRDNSSRIMFTNLICNIYCLFICFLFLMFSFLILLRCFVSLAISKKV